VTDRTQNIGWLILFLVASGFIGFITASFLGMENTISYLFVGLLLTMVSFAACCFLSLLFKKKIDRKNLWAMLGRGCYHEVNHRIDEDGREMKYLWELKMLACFHSGEIDAFERLYMEHMNEINECKSLPSYMVCVLKDLMNAISRNKPPAVFLKNDESKKHSYHKQREYQLYRSIQQGVKEYYRKAQQYVFDSSSLMYAERLKSQIYDVRKGTGYQQFMDNEMNRNRSNHPVFENTQEDSLNRSFSFDQPSFRREKTEQGFASRRHSADIQREFDEMNASLSGGSAFSLYEDDDNDPLRSRKSREDQSLLRNQSIPQEDGGDDLDPTWFARKPMESATNHTQNAAFFRRTPMTSDTFAYSQQQNAANEASARRNPMAQPMTQSPDATMRTFSFQDNANQTRSYQKNPQTFASADAQSQTRRNMEDPIFVNQQNPVMNPQQTLRQRDPQARMNPQQLQDDRRMQGYRNMQDRNMQDPRMAQTARTAQDMQNMGQMTNNRRMETRSNPRIDEMETSSYAYQNYQDGRYPTQPSLQAQKEVPVSNKKKEQRFSKQKKKRDPFDFEPTAQTTKKRDYQSQAQPKNVAYSDAIQDRRPYHTYVKHNVIIFFITLLDAVAISITTSSLVYTTFFKKFSSVNSSIVPDIILMSLIITLIMAYLTAGIHTGYTIIKKSLRTWNPALKILLSPLLLIVSLLIGAVGEIPYLIYACIKKGNE